MQTFSVSPTKGFIDLWSHRGLLQALVHREIVGRYRGSVVGLLWAFFNPLLMLLVYTFVFSVVFKARWDVLGGESKTEFALVLFAGLMVFNFFSECIQRAPQLILSNVSYVKKVVFPLEILAWVTLGSALFHSAVSLIVWLLAYCLLFGTPHATVLYLPVVLLPLIMFTLGITWIVAALSVYLRDISQMISMGLTILMFLSPIFYPISALPEKYRIFLLFNPLTVVIEQVRDVLFFGKMPDMSVTLICCLGASVIAWLGFALFQKTRSGFADML